MEGAAMQLVLTEFDHRKIHRRKQNQRQEIVNSSVEKI